MPPLPDACALMATLIAAQRPVAPRTVSARVLLHHVGGPSGANLLGRFCHADPDLLANVAEHLREEEALDPDAIFAEVVHLPEGRLGNVLLRPVLRPRRDPVSRSIRGPGGSADSGHRSHAAPRRTTGSSCVHGGSGAASCPG